MLLELELELLEAVDDTGESVKIQVSIDFYNV